MRSWESTSPKPSLMWHCKGADGRVRRKSCREYARPGFENWTTWLHRHEAPHVHACLEATGTRMARRLPPGCYDARPPRQRRQSHDDPRLRGQSTESHEDGSNGCHAHRAAFVRRSSPALWAPTPRRSGNCKRLVRRLDALHEMRTQETQSAGERQQRPPPCNARLQTVIDTLTEEIDGGAAADSRSLHPASRACAPNATC